MYKSDTFSFVDKEVMQTFEKYLKREDGRDKLHHFLAIMNLGMLAGQENEITELYIEKSNVNPYLK
jgi:hypothetical protein